MANQLCNTFASDWADDGSPDSDAWKNTGTRERSEPGQHDVLGLTRPWEPGAVRSVYGYREELFYQPGTYAQVPIYRWKLVPTRGTSRGP